MVTTTGAGRGNRGERRAAQRETQTVDHRVDPPSTVFWDFEKLPARLKSDWKYPSMATLRPNQGVLRVDVGDFDPSKHKKRELLIVGELPGRIGSPRRTSAAWSSIWRSMPDWVGPADAIVRIVMQSPANYWMVIGTVALAGHADWRHHELVTDAPASVAAMPQAYNVWFGARDEVARAWLDLPGSGRVDGALRSRPTLPLTLAPMRPRARRIRHRSRLHEDSGSSFRSVPLRRPGIESHSALRPSPRAPPRPSAREACAPEA